MVAVPGTVFRTAVLLVGRAGGLFSVLPVLDRAAVVLVVFMKDGVFDGVAFTPVNGRFGGTASLVAGLLFVVVESSIEGISSVAAMMKIPHRQTRPQMTANFPCCENKSWFGCISFNPRHALSCDAPCDRWGRSGSKMRWPLGRVHACDCQLISRVSSEPIEPVSLMKALMLQESHRPSCL